MYYLDSISPTQKVILKRLDGVVYGIPEEPANSDYQQYLAWVQEGNTPEPWSPNAD